MARFSILEMGLWDVPRNEMISPESEKVRKQNLRYTISGFSVLIQDPSIGNILWDRGICEDWEAIWPEQFKTDYTIHKLGNLTDKLQELELGIGDIDLLICSHLHYDHAGNLRLFRNTRAGSRVLISRAEAQEAFPRVNREADGVSGAYFREEFEMDGIGYQMLEEDTWLSDDVFLFIQRGHTPGVIGVLIKTQENGNFLFPSDAVYSPYNYGPPVVLPGLCVDPESYTANIERTRRMQQEYDARIFFSHDVDEFEKVMKSPWVYE